VAVSSMQRKSGGGSSGGGRASMVAEGCWLPCHWLCGVVGGPQLYTREAPVGGRGRQAGEAGVQ